MPQQPLPATLSVAETAEYFGLCTRTVYNLLNAGELACLPKLRIKRITRKSIEAYLDRAEVGAA